MTEVPDSAAFICGTPEIISRQMKSAREPTPCRADLSHHSLNNKQNIDIYLYKSLHGLDSVQLDSIMA